MEQKVMELETKIKDLETKLEEATAKAEAPVEETAVAEVPAAAPVSEAPQEAKPEAKKENWFNKHPKIKKGLGIAGKVLAGAAVTVLGGWALFEAGKSSGRKAEEDKRVVDAEYEEVPTSAADEVPFDSNL